MKIKAPASVSGGSCPEKGIGLSLTAALAPNGGLVVLIPGSTPIKADSHAENMVSRTGLYGEGKLKLANFLFDLKCLLIQNPFPVDIVISVGDAEPMFERSDLTV